MAYDICAICGRDLRTKGTCKYCDRYQIKHPNIKLKTMSLKQIAFVRSGRKFGKGRFGI